MDKIRNIDEDQDREWHYPYFKSIERKEQENNSAIGKEKESFASDFCGLMKDYLSYDRVVNCKSRDEFMRDYYYLWSQKNFYRYTLGLLVLNGEL